MIKTKTRKELQRFSNSRSAQSVKTWNNSSDNYMPLSQITARTIISSWKKVLPKHSCSPRPDVDSATEPEAMEIGDDHSTSSHTSTSSTAAELEEHTSQLQATCDELQSLVGRVSPSYNERMIGLLQLQLLNKFDFRNINIMICCIMICNLNISLRLGLTLRSGTS